MREPLDPRDPRAYFLPKVHEWPYSASDYYIVESDLQLSNFMKLTYSIKCFYAMATLLACNESGYG